MSSSTIHKNTLNTVQEKTISTHKVHFRIFTAFYRGTIISVGRALDCRAGGPGFDSRGWTNTQGLKITEK